MTGSAAKVRFEDAKRRTIASYERELERHRRREGWLREAVAREEALLRQKDELIQRLAILSKESDHRLLNGLQMIVSLLSIQSRESNNAEVASQLLIAANRVGALSRVHRHLHALEEMESVAFKPFLEKLCRDISGIASNERDERAIVVDGTEIRIPAATAIPLGFIASELITNAIKYAHGNIRVRLAITPEGACELSIVDEGPGLPAGFDPAASAGLGMKIVTSLVRQIGGELHVQPGPNDSGSCFKITCPAPETRAIGTLFD
jgi:two-component system, sensor histidine kinase PdtaS